MSVSATKKLFYLYAFFSACILIYPLYAVMFADNGLSATQISLLFIVWSAISFLLEVPSGAIADKYPRKYVLLIATILHAATFASWLLWPTFWGFLVGFIIWGISSALASGTQEALVYDELKKTGSEKQYAKVTGRMETIDILAMIIAGFIAATLAHLGYTPLLLLSIAAALLSTVVLTFLPKAKPIETTGEEKYWTYLVDGVKLVLRNKKIFFLVLFMGVVTGLGAVDEYYDLLLNEQGMSNTMIAFWIGVIYIFGAIGSSLAYRLEGKKVPLIIGVVVWGILLLPATLLPFPYAPLALGLFVSFFYIVKILFNTYLQHELTDKNRATATSVGGLLSEIGALISFGIFAIVAETHSYAMAFQVVAVIIVVIGLVFGILRYRYDSAEA